MRYKVRGVRCEMYVPAAFVRLSVPIFPWLCNCQGNKHVERVTPAQCKRNGRRYMMHMLRSSLIARSSWSKQTN
jgi:hypothetical protein